MTTDHGTRTALASALNTTDVFRALGIPTGTSPVASMDGTRVTLLAEQLLIEAESRPFRRAAWDDALFWNVEAGRAERSQFFAIGNAINFRFWKLVGGEVVPATGTIEG